MKPEDTLLKSEVLANSRNVKSVAVSDCSAQVVYETGERIEYHYYARGFEVRFDVKMVVDSLEAFTYWNCRLTEYPSFVQVFEALKNWKHDTAAEKREKAHKEVVEHFAGF